MESKKEIVKDKCEVDKTCEENTHLEKESDHNSTENIASESDEMNEKIPIAGDTSTDNTVESERANLECDKKTVVEQDKRDKIIEESLQDNSNVDLKYERTRLEELEEIMEDWIKFNFTEHESEEEYLFAQEKMIKIQEEKQVSLEEWDTIWMMFAAKKLEESEEEIEEIEDENEVRRDLQNDIVGAKNLQVGKSVYFMNDEIFLLEVPIIKHGKPKIIKADRTETQKGFIKKDRELKIESKKGKQVPCADTYFMRGIAKERKINWCAEYKLNKVILLNYTERGKQSINIGLRKNYQK